MMQYEVVEMEQIQKDLMPVLLKPGATSCEYLEFVDIYQFMMRVFAREGISSQLLLLTLVGPQGAELESSGMLEGARSSLESAIQKTIRCSDLYTRYGSDQFLVLLASTEQQGGEEARERIQERYCAINPGIRRSHCDVSCAISVRMSHNVAHGYCQAVINP